MKIATALILAYPRRLTRETIAIRSSLELRQSKK